MAKTLFAASLIALLCGGICTSAHHSVAVNFDSSQVLTLTGRITDLDIRNPHSQVTLQVTQPDGTVKEWFIEWSDRNALVRRKVPFHLLRVGDTVTINASPSRRRLSIERAWLSSAGSGSTASTTASRLTNRAMSSL